MRIALFTETYFPQINGVSRSLDRLVDHLVTSGDTVRLYIPRYREPLTIDSPKVTVRSFRSVALPFYREILLPLVSARTLCGELAQFQPDLIHIATEGTLGRAALKASRRFDCPVASSYHTNFSTYLRSYGAGWLESTSWSYLRRFHNATSVTFCPTPSILELLEENGFERVRTWGRGVDSERFHPRLRDAELRRSLGIATDETVLLYAGRLAAEKNLEMLMEAFRRLNGDHRARLLFVGDGPLREKLQREAPSGVLFTGYKHGAELAAVYASADLFLFPSLTETFGNVILEGMASGLPAVGFDVPGPKDIIRHCQTGWLVPAVSPSCLAATVETLLDTPEMILRAGREARLYAETQTWPRINDVVRSHYLDLLRSRVTSFLEPSASWSQS